MKVFKTLDTNNDGVIQREELVEGNEFNQVTRNTVKKKILT